MQHVLTRKPNPPDKRLRTSCGPLPGTNTSPTFKHNPVYFQLKLHTHRFCLLNGNNKLISPRIFICSKIDFLQTSVEIIVVLSECSLRQLVLEAATSASSLLIQYLLNIKTYMNEHLISQKNKPCVLKAFKCSI